MKGIKTWFKALSPIMKIVVVVVLLIVVRYVFIYVKTYIATSKQKTEANAETKALEATGMEKTYPDTQYSSWADDLATAMAGPGANWVAVNRIMGKMENDLDVIQLTKAFGIRDSFLSSSADLKGWLNEESMIDVKAINNTFAGKGITKTF